MKVLKQDRANAGREGTTHAHVIPELAGDARIGSVELGESSSMIDEIVREGARRMLAQALQAEVEERIARFADERDERGHRLVVGNGDHCCTCTACRAGTSGRRWGSSSARQLGCPAR